MIVDSIFQNISVDHVFLEYTAKVNQYQDSLMAYKCFTYYFACHQCANRSYKRSPFPNCSETKQFWLINCTCGGILC